MRATYSTHLFLCNFIILITSGEKCNYEAPRVSVFCSLPFHPSLMQIYSSTPCSQTPSVYVLPLMWETKLHTLIKLEAEKLGWYICGFRKKRINLPQYFR
jgi:hypothetical protein